MDPNTFITGPPGIYYGVPDDIYFATPGWSQSGLKRLDTSPAKARGGTWDPPSAPMYRGTAAHLALQDLAAFNASYTISGACEATTQAGNPCRNWGKVYADGEWLCGVHGKKKRHEGPLALSPSDYDLICQWRTIAMTDPDIRALWRLDGNVEVAMKWIDPRTGLLCKGRIDFLSKDGSTVYDWKTTREGGFADFCYHLERYRYHWQQAFYTMGAEVLDVKIESFFFIALGTDLAHSVHSLPAEVIRRGEAEVNALLDRALTYTESGVWPDVAESVHLNAGWGAEMAKAAAGNVYIGSSI